MNRFLTSTPGLALMIVFVVMALVSVAGPVYAFTAPAAGDFAYDLYDIFFNDIVGGPIGYIIGGTAIGYGLYQVAFTQSITTGIASVLVGAGIAGLNALTSSLGMIV